MKSWLWLMLIAVMAMFALGTMIACGDDDDDDDDSSGNPLVSQECEDICTQEYVDIFNECLTSYYGEEEVTIEDCLVECEAGEFTQEMVDCFADYSDCLSLYTCIGGEYI